MPQKYIPQVQAKSSNVADLEATFGEATAAHRQGKLMEAERIYAEILRQQPNHFEALHRLGIIAAQTRRTELAVERFRKAIMLNEGVASAHRNLGHALLELGMPTEALLSYGRAIALSPDDAEIQNGRGLALQELQRFEESIKCFDRAIALNPKFADAHYHRGVALQNLKRFHESLECYERAIALKPNFAEAFTNRGGVLRHLGRPVEALASYDSALALEPGNAAAHLNRGNTLRDLGRLDEVLATYDKAIAIQPSFAEAYSNRGSVLKRLKRFGEALNSFDRSIELKPDSGELYTNRATTLQELERYSEALASFDKAFSLKPDLKYAKGDWIRAKLQVADWTNLDAAMSEVVAAIKAAEPATAPFQFLAISASPDDQLQCSKRFMADQPSFPQAWRGEIYAHDRIRIGYFSADFCNHPVTQLAVGLFEAHDKTRFETVGISFGPDDGSHLRHRIKSAFEDFIDVSDISDPDLAALIRRREIDVVIDLTGLTRYNRFSVLSRRVAPIQVNFLGYPGTMGADCMDYIIADRTIIPEDHFRFYSERVVWLPDTYQPNDNKRHIAERKPTRQECGLPDNAFVFCCFNNTYKITPNIFDIWMRLLAAIPNSVLWLSGANAIAEENLCREAERRGIASARVIFAPKMPLLADHLARSAQADLFLDTVPYNAHTTGSDALWAGVPLLTCLGSAFASRVGASLVRAVGLNELATDSLQDYEAMALKLAREPAYLRTLREKLARNRITHPLFDTARFTRHIETAYTIMWQRYQSGTPPKPFAVEPIS